MRLLWFAFLGACLAASPAHAQASRYEENVRDLPSTWRVWSVLENQFPWTVTDPMDAAGLETGDLPLFGALGASWTENQYLLNGFDVTDSYIPGRPLLDPPLDALSALHITSSTKPAADGTSGTTVQMESLIAPQDFAGSAQVFVSGDSLQTGHPQSEQMHHLVDAFAHAGGTMGGRIPVVLAAYARDLSKAMDGFPAVIEANHDGILAEAVPYRNGQTRVNVFFSAERLFDSHAGATPFTSPAATLRDSMKTTVFQLRGQSARFDFRFGFVHSSRTSAFQNGSEDSMLELPERMLSGSAPLAVSGTQTRLESSLTARKEYSEHSIRADVQYDWTAIDNRWDGRTQHILVDGVATQTLRWNEPGDWTSRIHEFAVSVQDHWTPLPWLVIPAGLRFVYAKGGPISWTGLEPRLEAQIAVRGQGPRLMGSWSRYGHSLQGRYLDFGNASAPGGGFYDGDTLIRRFGGPYSEIDERLKQPYTDEIVAGLDQQLPGNWSIGARFFRRDDHRMIGIGNTGVPDSTYTPTTVTDPGNDGIEGTPDDATLLLFNRDPATFGKDFLLLANAPDLNNTCKGLRIYIEKSFSGGWDVSASFAALKTAGATSPGNSSWQNDVGFLVNLGTDPNTRILANSTTFFDRGFIGKLTAVRHWSHGLRTGIVARYYDGLPFGRLLFVPGFQQGPFFVRATPRDNFPEGFRTEFNATLDVRLAKDFDRWTAIVDLFNLLNFNRNTWEDDLTGPLFASRVPVMTQAPFAVRLGLQWRF